MEVPHDTSNNGAMRAIPEMASHRGSTQVIDTEAVSSNHPDKMSPSIQNELEQQSPIDQTIQENDDVVPTPKLEEKTQVFQDQLLALQSRLDSLEGLGKPNLRNDYKIPLNVIGQFSEFNHVLEEDLAGRYGRGYLRFLREDYEGTEAGHYISQAIPTYERELKRLKTEDHKIREVFRDKERLQERVQELQEEVFELRKERAGVIRAAELGSTTPSEAADELNDQPRRLIPELKLLEWRQYKYSPEKEKNGDILYAIEVLKGDPIISFERPNNHLWGLGVNSRQAATTKVKTNKPATTSIVTLPGQAPLAERIRINSKYILTILEKIHGDSWDNERPLVMVRPYKFLDYHNDAIHLKFEELQKKFGSDHLNPALPTDSKPLEIPDTLGISKNGDSVHTAFDSGAATLKDIDVGTTDENENGEDEYTMSRLALQHLKCLIDFMDGEIRQKLDYLNSNQCQTVIFSDIWYLFSPGMEVIEQARRQVYRILSISSAPHEAFSPYRNLRWDQKAKEAEETPVFLHCVHIDFDGKRLGPVLRTIRIPRFEGERAVTSLEVFPLRFAETKDSEENSEVDSTKLSLRKRLIARGKMFLDVTTFKHMHYGGITLDTREEVDSHVVVDFAEAFLHQPQHKIQSVPDADKSTDSTEGKAAGQTSWMPSLQNLIGEPPEVEFEEGQCSALCCVNDRIHKSQPAEHSRNLRHMASLMPEEHQREPSLMIYCRLLEDIKLQGELLSDDDFLIMSARVFGFVLRSRKWAKLDLDHLSLPETLRKKSGSSAKIESHPSHIGASLNAGFQTQDAARVTASDLKGENEPVWTVEEESKTVFGQLVLPKGHKEMVKSLIAQHFREKDVMSRHSRDIQQVDIVRGKGKGLIILLHGAPGVGKTTTAEGVAEMFKKPLFQITCGDLGTTASEVEKSLETHFALANRWGCVLLLDEADVFLAARSKEDFKRNGLVSVFLRVLEYYAGILFLTTNRVGDFDEAFASRIHISLYYPQLDLESTEAIFKLNLGLIKERFGAKQRRIKIDETEILEFARVYFQAHHNEKWNGRQIRNACQTALALAEYRAQGSSHEHVADTKAVVHLQKEDLETVSEAYIQFMKYLTDIRGRDPDRWAKTIKIRAREIDILDSGNGNSSQDAKIQNAKGEASDVSAADIRHKSVPRVAVQANDPSNSSTQAATSATPSAGLGVPVGAVAEPTPTPQFSAPFPSGVGPPFATTTPLWGYPAADYRHLQATEPPRSAQPPQMHWLPQDPSYQAFLLQQQQQQQRPAQQGTQVTGAQPL